MLAKAVLWQNADMRAFRDAKPIAEQKMIAA